MTRIDEITADVFRISTYVEAAGLQFNQFLLRDEEPLLYHAGQNLLFDAVRDAVARLIDVASLRWIGFSHYEADECGALNRWLRAAPRALPLAGVVAPRTLAIMHGATLQGDGAATLRAYEHELARVPGPAPGV